MNEHKLWDSVKHPIGLADMVHVGWVQRLLRSAEWMGFPGPEPDLVVDGQTRVEAHARRVFDKFVELGIEYVAEPTDSEPGAQRIRPVNEVLAFRKATCIDLCVAFCCAALDAGIYPLILTVTADRGLNRHAIVLVPLDRVWANNCGALLETGFSRELLEVDGEALGTMVYESEGDPSGTWLAIDVQQVTEVGANWGAALSSGAQYIRDWEWDVCVDVGGLRSRTSDRELPPGGHIEKVLAPAYAALPEDFTPLQLIKARHGVVPYQQCAEMRQLREWAMTVPSDSRTGGNGRNADISVAVVTGAGGSGKTRMAAQLCHDLSTIGWYTGFLPSTTEVTDEELAALAKVATELLVVVDYAEEARRGLVARVVRKLRARESATRIVLTARGADTWWEEFYEEAEQDGTVLSNTLPLPIRGKQDVEADPWFFGRMYRRAVRQFSDMLNGAVPPDVEVPEGLGDTALDVVLRAWLAVCGNDEVAKKDMPTREELYDKVLSIEFTRWRKELKLGDISRDQLRRAAAALSLLAPSQDEDAVDDVLSRLPEWSQEHLLRSRFAELLVQSLLRDDGAESVSLRPDPVAEHLILAVFGKKPELLDRVLPQDPAKVPGIDAPDADDSIVTRKLEWGQQARNACVTLTRASSLDREAALCLARRALRERPFLWKEALDVALTQGGPFAQALTALIESGADLPLGKIDNEIPVGHPALAGAALAATRRLATSAERSPEQQAHWANNLSIRLSDVGERKVALEAAREAVELYRGLTEASPQAFTADLAGALSNLANRLSDVGERDEALGVAREAVGLFWGLAEASPQVFGPDMAGALSNLAVFLSGVGERDEALGVAREAVGLYRGLTEASPQTFTSNLAGALSNLANRLSDVGERDEAVRVTREAVGLYRGLAEASPAAYTPNLAASLNNLANLLSEVGERNEALVAARKAVALYRGLAEASPQAYTPNLAMSLNNLAAFLSEVGERNEALEAARKAVGLYRQLAEASPQAYRHELARSLSNLPALLSGVGERDEAVGVAREAVGLYRGLAEASPQAFRHELARSINNLANRLSDVGKRDKAVEIASEAVGLYRGLAQASPQAFSHYLAGALSNLANHLSGVGERDEALGVAREAVELYRGLAQASPQAFTPALAQSLSNLAALLTDVGKRDEAVRMDRQAVGLYRGLAQASPQAFTHKLAGALSNLANHLSGVGERDEAVGVAREAVGLYRGLAEASPQAFSHYLAGALSNLANHLSGVGERDEAVGVAREAVGLYRGLAEASPQAFSHYLAGALSNLATFLVESGHLEKAPNVFVEGLDHLSPAARAHLLCVRSTWRTDGRESEDLVGAAREANSTDDPGLLGPVRRMIARVITDAGISDTGLPRWVTVDAESATSRIEGWLECSDLARRVAFLEAQWSLPSASEKETLAALAELYVDRPSVAALAALVERIADEGIQAVTTDLRIQYRAQLLARDWYEAHLNGRGASFLREHMRVGVGAPREGGGDNAAMKTDPAEWDRDLSDPAMRSAVQDVLAEELPDVETTRMGLLLELADLSDPATAYEAYDSDEGAEDSLRHFLESHNWRAMLAVLGVRPGVADSAHGRIAALLAAAVGGESTERLRELYEYANEAMDAIDRRHLQALLDQALRTRQCPATFADILTWIKHPNSQTR